AVLLGHVAGQEGGVGVAVHAVDVGGHVDVYDVAVLDDRIVRDAVADDFVERRTAGLREAFIAKRRRVGPVVDHVLGGYAAQLVGWHAGRDGFARRGQRARRDAAGDTHLLDHLRRLHPGLTALVDGRLPRILRRHDRTGHRTRR